MNIQELAALMGQKESDVAAFVEGLRVWIAKGYTIEEAINKHLAQMVRMVDNAVKLSENETVRSMAVEAFYAEGNK